MFREQLQASKPHDMCHMSPGALPHDPKTCVTGPPGLSPREMPTVPEATRSNKKQQEATRSNKKQREATRSIKEQQEVQEATRSKKKQQIATKSNAKYADVPLARSSMTPQNVSHVPPARSSMIPQHVSHVPPACSREKWQLLQGKREVCAPACPTENPLGKPR